MVCEALGRGRQSVILRKGGIAEGRQGFSFKHDEFFLFPTWFHEQAEKVRWDGRLAPSNLERSTSEVERRLTKTNAAIPDGEELIEIRYAAKLDLTQAITSWEKAEALAPLHILRPEVVRQRFDYDDAPGLQVALVRMFRIEPALSFPNEPKYGGCRSWVRLPELPNDLKFEVVLTDDEHLRRRAEFVAITSADAVSSGP